MAGFPDALRGDRLARVQRALDWFEADPLRLDRTRRRFSQSPPPCTSNPSGTTTRSASPDPPSDEQRLRDQRRYQLIGNRRDEADLECRSRTSWMSQMPLRGTLQKNASEMVKKRWVEQGIWKTKWDEMVAGRYMDIGRWKHEEPLELEPETDTEADSPPLPFSFGISLKPPQPKLRRPKSDDDKRRIAERRVLREREREASRPYHQFVYQISKERERIQDESTSVEGAGVSIADINTRAYENVKNTWAKRGIWNERWGILPGMSWKHEERLEEEAGNYAAPVHADSLVNGNHETRVPTKHIFRSTSPVEPNQLHTSGALNSSQQRLPADIDSVELENHDAERPFSASISPRPRTGNRVLRPSTGQAWRPSRKTPSHKDGQPQAEAISSRGPVHSSKVSKAAGKKKPGPHRRPNASHEVSSGTLPSSSIVDVVEPQPLPNQATPRRSKRIQPHPPIVVKDSTRMVSTNASKRAVQSKTERNVANKLATRSSAKPQGISKRKPAKTARRKARKE